MREPSSRIDNFGGIAASSKERICERRVYHLHLWSPRLFRQG
jgi:hypothetical protein